MNGHTTIGFFDSGVGGLSVLRSIVGDGAAIIDPGPAVVEQLCRRLGLADTTRIASDVRLYTSGSAERLTAQANQLIGLRCDSESFAW